MRTANGGAVLVFTFMNAEHNRNDQSPDSGPPEENAAGLDHWEQLVKNVQALSPELKQMWYELRQLNKPKPAPPRPVRI